MVEEEKRSMNFALSDNCGSCPYAKQIYSDQFICCGPKAVEYEIFDVRAFEVSLDTRPDWCPMAQLIKKINELPEESKALLNKAYDGILAIFNLLNYKKGE